MEESDGKFVSNEKVQTGVRRMAVLLFSVGFAIAYWIWPSGITDIPLAQITLGGFLRVAAAGLVGISAFVMAALLWVD